MQHPFSFLDALGKTDYCNVQIMAYLYLVITGLIVTDDQTLSSFIYHPVKVKLEDRFVLVNFFVFDGVNSFVLAKPFIQGRKYFRCRGNRFAVEFYEVKDRKVNAFELVF